jgi:hypothetical protein
MDSQLTEEVPIASPTNPAEKQSEPSAPSQAEYYHWRGVIQNDRNSQHNERRQRRLGGRLFLFLVLVLFVIAVLALVLSLTSTHVGVMLKNLNPNHNFWASSSIHPSNILVPRDDAPSQNDAADGQPGEYYIPPTVFSPKDYFQLVLIFIFILLACRR